MVVLLLLCKTQEILSTDFADYTDSLLEPSTLRTSLGGDIRHRRTLFQRSLCNRRMIVLLCAS
jgi:hypothetical protein